MPKISARLRDNWIKEVENYILKRENLLCLFVLIDSRIKPQNSDINFMEMLGLNQIPFVRVFTKSDKVRQEALHQSLQVYDKMMLEKWEELPSTFITSAINRTGRDEILSFIENSVNIFKNGS